MGCGRAGLVVQGQSYSGQSSVVNVFDCLIEKCGGDVGEEYGRGVHVSGGANVMIHNVLCRKGNGSAGFTCHGSGSKLCPTRYEFVGTDAPYFCDTGAALECVDCTPDFL